MEVDEYRRVEQFCLDILNDTSILSRPRRLVLVRDDLGANCAYKDAYATA
jgi:hypothetical protein